VKTNTRPRLLTLFAGYALAAATPLASAALAWDFSSGCDSTNPNGFGNSYTCSSATVNAYSTTGAGSAFQDANAAFYSGGGFGVRNRSEGVSVGSPNHSMDNYGNTDTLAFSFAEHVMLNKIKLGWYQNDSDISVLRYTGSSAPVITGKSISDLLGNGWAFVGSYYNLAMNTTAINTSNNSSKWWLISSYNASYNSAVTAATYNPSGPDSKADYVKILALDGVIPPPTKVPEPGSIALLAAAILAMYGVRRRDKGQRRG
jgi:hypothetical protein